MTADNSQCFISVKAKLGTVNQVINYFGILYKIVKVSKTQTYLVEATLEEALDSAGLSID